jgi:hypothetical protein
MVVSEMRVRTLCWSVLAVVVASITELLFHNLRFFHALRPLRALRAIRVMTKSDGLRHVSGRVVTMAADHQHAIMHVSRMYVTTSGCSFLLAHLAALNRALRLQVLQAVWTAVVKLGSVSFVCLLFTFVFAIMGCALFKVNPATMQAGQPCMLACKCQGP